MNVHYASLIGASPAFVRALKNISTFTQSDATLLLSGETGTGKELFARAVHYHGLRLSKPFVPINCAALPDHLFENELFGHSRGAFTDAHSDQRGLLAEAEGGTLFLDEVNSLSLGAQAKLLRLLQEKEYRPLGGGKSRSANVRIIAATNSDLAQHIQERSFRQDLYYRLRTLRLHIPSLRERPEDIVMLATHFLNQYALQYNRGMLQFSSAAIQKLQGCSWPGNVRELQAVIHQAVLMCASMVVSDQEIDVPHTDSEPKVSTDASLRTLKDSAIQQFERHYLTELLAANEGNVSRAAKQAGKERRSFQRLLKKYGLSRSEFLRSA
jgi:two-component system response regulator GlrR